MRRLSSFTFPQEVNQITVSDVIDKVLREFLVSPEDVIHFCHDSAPYMSPAAGAQPEKVMFTPFLPQNAFAKTKGTKTLLMFRAGHTSWAKSGM